MPSPPKSETAKAPELGPEPLGGNSLGSDSLGTLGLFPDLWVLAMLVSLGLSAGLAPGSRGAAVGIDRHIDFIDRAASVSAQFAAVSTFFLLVHLGFSVARFGRRRWLTIPGGLLGLSVAMLLVSAQQITLSDETLLYAVFASGLATVLLAFSLAPKYRLARALLLTSAASLLLELAAPLSLGAYAAQSATTFAFAGAVVLTLASVAGLVYAARARGLTLALVLAAGGATLLLSRYTPTGQERLPIVILGRTVRALTEQSLAPAALASFLLGVLVVVCSAAIARRLFGSGFTPADLPLLGLLALLLLIGPTPLALAGVIVTALGFVALASRAEALPGPP